MKDYREDQRKSRKRLRMGWLRGAEPSKERKEKSHQYQRERSEMLRDLHRRLSGYGIARRLNGGRLGLRKRMRLAENSEK